MLIYVYYVIAIQLKDMDRIVGINTFYVGSGDYLMETEDKELLIGVCLYYI